MAAIIIETKTSFEEVEIYGKDYKVDFSDAKMEDYDKARVKFDKEKNDAKADDFKRNAKVVKDCLEMFFGKEDADIIYNESRKSSFVCNHIVMQLFKVLKDKMKDFNDKKLEEYLGVEEVEEQKLSVVSE
ncbi:hypothetical protein [Listeria newyorkensis]|uniref:Uncharacterized protein n=1 Tax=Listeria newyorkensis TaxID=1497681 RepID=A0A841Z0E2_9LIST|nr:hypothetical protein [Listeria newyorkensis]MBC1459075.1 hypothetical protein [Listeria newyorkensis]